MAKTKKAFKSKKFSLKNKKVVKKKSVSKSKKSSPKKKAAKSSLYTFATLALWKRVLLDKAMNQYDFTAATNGSLDMMSTFGENPEFFLVHEGSVQIGGNIKLNGWDARKGEERTVYVIDGDLTVNGALAFSQSDILTTLYVTGNVNVNRMRCGGGAMLLVGGNLNVKEIAVTSLNDSGHLIVQGSFASPVWLDLFNGRGSIECGTVNTRFLSDHFARLEQIPPGDGPVYCSNLQASSITGLHAEFFKDGEINATAIFEAIDAGTSLLE